MRTDARHAVVATRTRVPEQAEQPHDAPRDARAGGRQGRVRRPGETTIPDSVHRATEDLLGEATPEKLTVSRILERAGVSRTSFYYYFPSKDAVLASLLERIADELGAPPAHCEPSGSDARETVIRTRLEAAFLLWEQHAAVLRAAQDAPHGDVRLGVLWRELVEQRWVRPLGRLLAREQDAGRLPAAIDPLALARALTWMSERALFQHLASGGPAASVGEARRAAIDALTLVWLRTLAV